MSVRAGCKTGESDLVVEEGSDAGEALGGRKAGQARRKTGGAEIETRGCGGGIEVGRAGSNTLLAREVVRVTRGEV